MIMAAEISFLGRGGKRYPYGFGYRNEIDVPSDQHVVEIKDFITESDNFEREARTLAYCFKDRSPCSKTELQELPYLPFCLIITRWHSPRIHLDQRQGEWGTSAQRSATDGPLMGQASRLLELSISHRAERTGDTWPHVHRPCGQSGSELVMADSKFA
ncbi:hypothetical protein NPIL_438441 [Nephila pilipes]|uniref:Uncharacterized protein n=1 Tax=Nephila pilipes TaxID=299642 RepID=A0A8X6QJB3_NEPPI|nr:hypothetical protein NPIL_438441 [Nephila pilipes]